MNKQSGSSLIMVLIALAVMLVSTMAYVQSTETGNIVAGNITFKAAANSAAEVGIDQAVDELATQTDMDTAISNRYYPLRLTTDNNGLPAHLDWAATPSTVINGYTIQHITERLCRSNSLPIQHIDSQCNIGQLAMPSSNKLGAPIYNGSNAVYYRVTVRVVGPKNTLTFVQAILAK